MEWPAHPPLGEGGGVSFAIKESGWGESIINGRLNSKIIIMICQSSSGKSRKFSRSRMTKRTAPLSSSREI